MSHHYNIWAMGFYCGLVWTGLYRLIWHFSKENLLSISFLLVMLTILSLYINYVDKHGNS